MVWCNKESLDSVGYIDLVKTFNIGGIDKDTLLAYFFKSNDNGNLTVESVENSSGTLGLLIKNSGDGAGDDNNTHGFHLHQEKQVFDTVKMNYRMQGSSSTDTCDNESWIPLNGPGFARRP